MSKLLLMLLVTALCEQSFGKSCFYGKDCITDLQQSDCDVGYYLEDDYGVGGCCPACRVIPTMPSMCNAIKSCPKGTKCVLYECKPDKSECWHIHYLEDKEKPVYLPTCEPDGTYSAVQCRGDALAGRCFCADTSGKRIFGTSWITEAKDMTCACSRRRVEMELAGRTDVTLHCSDNGNYEKLQCDLGICWCVSEKNGEPLSLTVPEDLVSQLPCYDPDMFGSQYLRVCESKAYAIYNMKNLLKNHGTIRVSTETAVCDFDGSFGSYQIDKGIAFCSWTDGKRIEGYQSNAGSDLASVNCNCARDLKYFAAAGKYMNQICAGNGNYEPKQQLNGEVYCVDSDGYPTTELSNLGDLLICTR